MNEKNIHQTMDNLSQLLNYQTSELEETDTGVSSEPISESEERLSGGMNVLLYGVPGSGKSWTIEHVVTNGTVDEQILRALKAKDKTQSALIAAVKANLKI